MKIKDIKYLVYLLIFILVSGCFPLKRDKSPVAARVDKKILTEMELSKQVAELQLDADTTYLRGQFLNYWIDHQLLLYEAERRGFSNDPEIERKLELIRDEMIINRMLESSIEVKEPEEPDIINYWRDHTGEFTRSEEEVKLIIACAPDRNTGWKVRNGMDESRSGYELTGTYENLSIDTTDWVSTNRLPREINNNIGKLRVNDPSLPFKMGNHWYVVKLLNRARIGDPRAVEEVAEDIRARMKAEQVTLNKIEFIAGLRREARRKGIVQIGIPLMETESEHLDTSAVKNEH